MRSRMTWTQSYDPLQSALLSPLAAAVPVVVLLGLLASGRISAPLAALAGLTAAAPHRDLRLHSTRGRSRRAARTWAGTMLTAAGYGAAFGLLPIGWIVLNAVFLYTLTVETGAFEVVKRSVLALSDDRRVQALLIAFCFGAFLEGAAGFGTPVAVSAALMVGAGFRPLHAAGLALLANTAPVAFGALGTPIITLAQVTGLDELKLSAMAGRQLPFFSLIVPVWLVWVMAGWRGVRGVWPALLACGGTFAVVQFLVSNYHGPWLVDVVAGVVSLVALALLLRFWQPAETWRFPDEPDSSPDCPGAPSRPRGRLGVAAVGVPDSVRLRVGMALREGRAQHRHAEVGSDGVAPGHRPHAAGGEDADAGSRRVRVRLAVGDRHRHPACRGGLGSVAAGRAAARSRGSGSRRSTACAGRSSPSPRCSRSPSRRATAAWTRPWDWP